MHLTEDARLLYRELLRTPGRSLTAFAERMGISVAEAEAAWSVLLQVKLGTEDKPDSLHPVPAQYGYLALISETEQEAHRLTAAADKARALATELVAEYSEHRSHESILELTSLQAVRDRMVDLEAATTSSLRSFTPTRTLSAGTRESSQPLNESALQRGVSIHAIYPDSARHDPGALDYAEWLADRGSAVRTIPVVPIQMVLIDGEVAIIPIDPERPKLGALEIRNPGILTSLIALFERVWDHATPLGSAAAPNTHGLTRADAEVVRLLSAGYTDEAIARQLQISVRTLRRQIADLSERADAHSRFEFGVKAAARGWV